MGFAERAVDEYGDRTIVCHVARGMSSRSVTGARATTGIRLNDGLARRRAQQGLCGLVRIRFVIGSARVESWAG